MIFFGLGSQSMIFFGLGKIFFGLLEIFFGLGSSLRRSGVVKKRSWGGYDVIEIHRWIGITTSVLFDLGDCALELHVCKIRYTGMSMEKTFLIQNDYRFGEMV